jgi:hypothetical protein
VEIHLDSGDILTLTPEQATSLQAYVDHPSNQVPVFDPITAMTVYEPRWKTTDEWVEFIFNQGLAGALLTDPPPNVVAIQTRINTLNEEKRQALLPVKL